MSAKETEGILKKPGGFFSGFRCCILVCLTPAAGSTHCVRASGGICLSCAPSAHSPSVTSLPWPDPSDHLATAPSIFSRPCPTAGFQHPFTLPYQSWLLYSEGCFLVLGNWWPALAQRTSLLLWAAATLSSTSSDFQPWNRGLLLRFSFLGASLSVLGYPYRVLFIFSVIFLSYLNNSLH